MREEIFHHAHEARRRSHDRPNAALVSAWRAAVALCSDLYRRAIGTSGCLPDLEFLISRLSQRGAIPRDIQVALRALQTCEDHVAHDRGAVVDGVRVRPVLRALDTVIAWYRAEFAAPVSPSPTAVGRDDLVEKAERAADAAVAQALASARATKGVAPSARRPGGVAERPTAHAPFLRLPVPGRQAAQTGASPAIGAGPKGGARPEARANPTDPLGSGRRPEPARSAAITRGDLRSKNWFNLEMTFTTPSEREELAALYVERHDELERVGNRAEAALFMLRAARTYEGLGDIEQALAAAQIAFDEDIRNSETIDVLERLATSTVAWKEVLAVAVASHSRSSGVRRDELGAQIALWRATRLR